MRLLHVNAAYPPFLGGAEVYTRAISEHFAAAGHATQVVTTDAAEVESFWHPDKRRLSVGREVVNGVDVRRCSLGYLPGAPLSFYAFRRLITLVARLGRPALPLLRWAAPLMPRAPSLSRTLQALPETFDLVHGINIALEWPLIAAWRFARERGVPFVTTPFVHVGQAGRSDVLINYVMPHQMEVLQGADAVIVQTDIERRALANLGVPAARIHRLGMGVALDELQGGDAERFRGQHGLTGPIVTFLGVVTYDKGSFHLLRAMERLWSGGAQAHLVIAGPTVDEFERFYRRLPADVRGRVLLLGPVTGQGKQDLLAATDVFALPSRIDSFGIVYLEAWAYNHPVIGACAGGVPDVVDDGRDGLLVDFGDVPALATAIEDLLADPARRRQMGRLGREKVTARYTWQRICLKLEEIYEGLLR